MKNHQGLLNRRVARSDQCIQDNSAYGEWAREVGTGSRVVNEKGVAIGHI